MPFPPIFVVTLAEEPWKGYHTRSHFADFGITPTFVYGVQGVTIGLRPTNPADYNNLGQPLYVHSSQIGCALSHIMALNVAISTNADEFIICEDDIILHPKFVEMYEKFRDALPPDTDVAQLDHRGAGDKPGHKLNEYAWKSYYPFCTSCIWWTRRGAKAAIPLLKPIDRPYDQMLMQRVYPFLNHAIAIPPLALDRSSVNQWPSAVGDAPKISDTNAEIE